MSRCRTFGAAAARRLACASLAFAGSAFALWAFAVSAIAEPARAQGVASQAPAVAASPTPPPQAARAPSPSYDAALASKLGADERGMRSYVLVILKTGPTKVAPGPERDAMFKGHFANIERLAAAGKLAVAGPFSDDADGWRGLYLFAVSDVEEARRLVAADPVIVKGEMVGEFHPWYGSAALMVVPETHRKLTKANR